MNNLLLSLGVGIALIVTANFVLGRWLGARRGALFVFGLTVLIYGPFALLFWPGGDVFAIHMALFLTVSLMFGLLRDGAGKTTGSAWGPAIIVLFFALVVAVDTVFVLVSESGLSSGLARALLPSPMGAEQITSSFPGTVVPGMARRDALYERHIEKIESQRSRGWEVRKGWLSQPVVGHPAVFQIAVTDRTGHPVAGADVVGDFMRPSDRTADQAFTMLETERGIYRASLVLPAPGAWNLLLRIRRSEDLHELRGLTTVADAGS